MRRAWPAGAAAALLLVAATVASLPAAAQASVEARLEPGQPVAGGPARLVVEVGGGVFDRLRPRASFDTRNLTVVGGPDRIENIEWVNGVTRRRVALVWSLRAGEPGLAAIESLVVEVAGERYELSTITAEVVAPGPGEDADGRTRQQRAQPRWRLPDPLAELLHRRFPPASPEPPEIHLVAEATPLRVWNGEQILYTLYLYTQTSIANVSADRLPDFRGFWVEEVAPPDERQPAERVVWRGEVFWRTPLLERVLFPLRPGRHVVEAAEVEALPRPDADPWAARSMLERPRAQALRSGQVMVDVLPLPPPQGGPGASFSGLVGRFDLAARVLPTTVRAGEAATLEVTLSGRGNLEALDAPPLPALPGFEVLPAQEEGGNRIVGRGVEGRRVWRFPVVPAGPGERQLPPITVSYFDPAAEEYRLATTRPLALAVLPAATDPGGGDRHPIRSAAHASDAGVPWRRLVPWAFALPWLASLVLALTRRPGPTAASAEPSQSALVRHFEDRLSAASEHQRPRQAAREIEQAWRELLHAALGVPLELPPTSWAAELPPAARAGGRGDELSRVVADLHYLRFAPQLSAVGELSAELVERSRRLARGLVASRRPPAAAEGRSTPSAAASATAPRGA